LSDDGPCGLFDGGVAHQWRRYELDPGLGAACHAVRVLRLPPATTRWTRGHAIGQLIAKGYADDKGVLESPMKIWEIPKVISQSMSHGSFIVRVRAEHGSVFARSC
jgi:hypothetical protein